MKGNTRRQCGILTACCAVSRQGYAVLQGRCCPQLLLSFHRPARPPDVGGIQCDQGPVEELTPNYSLSWLPETSSALVEFMSDLLAWRPCQDLLSLTT
jgi:hypothetical protein